MSVRLSRPPCLLELDDFEEQEDIPSPPPTWSVDSDGTMRHVASGTEVSTDRGIIFKGHDYHLSPEDITICNSQLGVGSGGSVQMGVIKQGGSCVAVKTIRMHSKEKRNEFLSEIQGLVQAEGCPYLVQWYAAFASKSQHAVQIVEEFMDMGSLYDLKVRLGGEGVPTGHLSCLTMQVTRGLEHLHARRLLHRDIKPQNVLLNCLGEVKLADFGIARLLDAATELSLTVCGTQTYMSPERCKGEHYSFTSDIWSVGMVVHEMATGRFPFDDISSFVALLDNLCSRPEPRLDPARFPPKLCSFVRCCLKRDATSRPEAEELAQHAFVIKDVGSFEDLAMWLATIS
mmetsp:Transcript_29887/g.65193  ORF Transcript_29887/g.65193 Transcript_29887/m.65193 type:complete len:344 (-) Transcript_29887:250-1281(-)